MSFSFNWPVLYHNALCGLILQAHGTEVRRDAKINEANAEVEAERVLRKQWEEEATRELFLIQRPPEIFRVKQNTD